VIHLRMYRAFTSCALNHRSSATQHWFGSGVGSASVVASGLKFTNQSQGAEALEFWRRRKQRRGYRVRGLSIKLD
jgi:hypothetical protein